MKRYKIFVSIMLSVFMLGGMTGFASADGGQPSTAYEMYVDARQVGVVKFAAKGLALYDDVEEKIRKSYSEEVFIEPDVYFKEVKADSNMITSEDELTKAIEEAVNVRVNAYDIVIDGKKTCYVKTLDDAEKVMADVKAPYVENIEKNDNTILEDIKFKEDVSYIPEIANCADVLETDKALEMILQGAEEIKEYEAKDGDSLWSIAVEHGIAVSTLEKANPDIDPKKIRPGDIIKMGEQVNLINVITKEKSKYTEEVPYETETIEDKNLEKGKTKIVKEGEKGKKEFTVSITKENGKEISRETIEVKVVKEPVKHIIAKGTKIQPRKQRSVVSRSKKTTTTSQKKPAASIPKPTSRGSARGSDIVSYAKKFLGKPYVYGTAGPNSFDCSGFTWYVFRQFGRSIPRGSGAQAGAGIRVSKSEMAPGDLVLFTSPNSGGGVGHAGIYIGGGSFIHASSGSSMCVKISTLNSGNYARRFVTGRRVY